MTDLEADHGPTDGTEPSRTGDPAVDEALARLQASAASGDVDAQAEAGEAVDQILRGRLADLGSD